MYAVAAGAGQRLSTCVCPHAVCPQGAKSKGCGAYSELGAASHQSQKFTSSKMQFIEQYLPAFQFRERHSIIADSLPRHLLEAALLTDATEDPWAKRFIRLRELPDRVLGSLGARSGLQHRPVFGLHDFMPLGADMERELAFGLVGRFWQRDYGLVRLDAPQAQFAHYLEPNLAKLVLNFSVEVLPDGRTRLMTETRVHCSDAQALRSFTPYWWLIRPVSGLIRRRLLARIRDVAASRGP